jgi:peptide/nickel transport system substrate-binding protein
MKRDSEVQMVQRRGVLRLIGLGGGAWLVAACSQAPAPALAPSATSAPAPTAAAPASTAPAATVAATTAPAATPVTTTKPAAEQPKPGGSLRWGLLGNIVTLDGHNYGGTAHIFHVFDRLILLDEKLNWQPRLAESWDINADYTQFKLNLRKGVQYHSGREFTSADALWNFNRVKDPAVGGGIFASYVAPLKSVEAPDKYTLVVTSNQPYPYISHILQTLNMLDPVSMQQPEGANNPVGTGPFRFVEYAQGDHLTLARNPNYWRSGLPYIDQLKMSIFTDPQTMVTALESGGLDTAVNVPLRDASRLQKDANYQVILNQNSGAMYGIIANMTLEPMAHKGFRQALQHAIDRQRIVETVLLGLGTPTQLPWFPTSPAYDETKNRTYTFDLDKARSLLQQAGVSNASVDFNYSSAIAEFGSIAQIVQADAQKIGIALNLKPTDPPQLAGMQYQVAYPGISAGTPLFGQAHPGVQFGSPYFGPLNNWTGIKDPQFLTLSTAMSTEVEATKAKQAYAAWNDYVLDQSFTIGIATFLPRVAATARVRDVHYDLAYILDATEAWLT